MNFADQVIKFHLDLAPKWKLPKGIQVLTPLEQAEGQRVFSTFYQQFYSDHNSRYFLFGINPGRFGAGVTGVSFTDPIRLDQACHIPNKFPKKSELSSEFIYQVIDALGGPKKFFRHFYITAVSPLGFIKDGLNINYYDDKNLLKVIEPFAIESMHAQVKFGCLRQMGICIGQGKNFAFINTLNAKNHWFDKVQALPHPRWVMQYRRRTASLYVQEYVEALGPLMDYTN